ncbi:MAG: hypothetical protein ACK5L3_08595, partial [Oscillospiraceae bacterium]
MCEAVWQGEKLRQRGKSLANAKGFYKYIEKTIKIFPTQFFLPCRTIVCRERNGCLRFFFAGHFLQAGLRQKHPSKSNNCIIFF